MPTTGSLVVVVPITLPNIWTTLLSINPTTEEMRSCLMMAITSPLHIRVILTYPLMLLLYVCIKSYVFHIYIRTYNQFTDFVILIKYLSNSSHVLFRWKTFTRGLWYFKWKLKKGCMSGRYRTPNILSCLLHHHQEWHLHLGICDYATHTQLF